MSMCMSMYGGWSSGLFMYRAIANLYFAGAFGKVFRGEMRRSDCSKFEDIAIKTIKSELYLYSISK